MFYTSGFVDDMFADNRRRNGNTNSAYTQSDSQGGSAGGEV